MFSVTGPVCGWLSGFCVEVPLVFVAPCPALGYKTFCSEGFSSVCSFNKHFIYFSTSLV